jgi:hypothetical protein
MIYTRKYLIFSLELLPNHILQHNGQKKKYKRTNNDLQSITHKTKDRVTRTPLKTGVNSGILEG